ncbi:transposase [Streptomyces asoensis]|uniref:Transposase n=1 Tax=Streptomyces asoensis TaxID=249586 RepID=A0A6M4X2H7_9ACTN|nr:transposase [Streptomyces asoensis]
MGVHRAVPADRRVRPVPGAAATAVRGAIWRFKTGRQWREVPQEFGAWSTVHNRFRQRRDTGVFEALLEGQIAEAVKRGEVDLSLVSIDSTTARSPRPRWYPPGPGRPHRPGEGHGRAIRAHPGGRRARLPGRPRKWSPHPEASRGGYLRPHVREYLAGHMIGATLFMWPATFSLELPPQN